MAARGLKQAGRIIIDRVRYERHGGCIHQAAERGGIRHGAHLRKRVGVVALLHQLHLTFPVGVAHAQAQQESVELRRGQELRSGRADGILRRQHEKRLRQRMRLPVDGHAALLHSLQQGRLRLGGGTVDLVRQQQVRHDRARLVGKGSRLLVIDGEAQNVRRHRVRRELHAAGLQPERACEGHSQRRLADAGHVVQQHMALRQHGHQDLFHDLPLAEDDLLHLAEHLRRKLILFLFHHAASRYFDSYTQPPSGSRSSAQRASMACSVAMRFPSVSVSRCA